MDAHTVRIVDVTLEGMGEQVELEAEAHHGPILETEGREERLAAADVKDVLDAEDVKLVKIDFAVFLLLLLFLLRLLHGLVLLLLLGLDNLALLRGLLFRLLRGHLLRHRSLRLVLLRGRRRRLLGLLGGLVCGLLGDLRLVDVLLAVPRLQDLLPVLPLCQEPVARLQVLDARGRLLVLDPLLQELLALRLLGPLEGHLVEALVLLRDRELDEGRVHAVWREVGDRALTERLFLLFVGELDGGRILIHSLVLLLGFFRLLLLRLFLLLLFLLLHVLLALCRGLLLLFLNFQLLLDRLLGLLLLLQRLSLLLLQLLLLLLQLLFLLRLGELDLELQIGLLLLLLERELLASLLEGRRRLAHHHLGPALQARGGPLRDELLALIRDDVGLHLHDNVVPLLQRGDGLKNPLDTVVIQGSDTKAELRLVVGALDPSGLDDAALCGPLQDGAVRELRVTRVLLQEHVQPIEGALVRQAHREDDLVLGILRR
mmetsp:Transcript_39748/g.101057  ORF Transcript_39748/g.101057 Transcript_39748/m.101057 type:complete len:487 (-) Transcript_39748:138-1598(-)